MEMRFHATKFTDRRFLFAKLACSAGWEYLRLLSVGCVEFAHTCETSHSRWFKNQVHAFSTHEKPSLWSVSINDLTNNTVIKREQVCNDIFLFKEILTYNRFNSETS